MWHGFPYVLGSCWGVWLRGNNHPPTHSLSGLLPALVARGLSHIDTAQGGGHNKVYLTLHCEQLALLLPAGHICYPTCATSCRLLIHLSLPFSHDMDRSSRCARRSPHSLCAQRFVFVATLVQLKHGLQCCFFSFFREFERSPCYSVTWYLTLSPSDLWKNVLFFPVIVPIREDK